MSFASRFVAVRLEHACRLVNHGPTVLVTSGHGGRRDVMAAAWSMPVEFVPPRVAVCIDKKTLTAELARAGAGFGLVVPGATIVDLTHAVGSVSGRDVDKFDRFAIEAGAGPTLGVPIIEHGCAAWLECRWIPEPHSEGAYDTWFAEVVSAAADPRVFADGHWTVNADNADLHTIHHLGGGHFGVIGPSVFAKPL